MIYTLSTELNAVLPEGYYSRRQARLYIVQENRDIRACFDRINHDWLLSHVPMNQEILQKWWKSGYLESHVFHTTEEGTPQGGIISPVRANLALDGRERRLAANFSASYRAACQNKVNLVRYADDFGITGSSKELLETQVKPLVEKFLLERGLELSQEKTTITHIEDGFDFLGQPVCVLWRGKATEQPKPLGHTHASL